MKIPRNMEIVAALWFVLLLASCNAFESIADKSSREAKLEEAAIAMDHGDFQTAVSILAALDARYPGDAEIRRDLASAYMGRAGLNFFDLASKAQTAADNASLSDVKLITGIFPKGVTDSNLADIDIAVASFQTLSEASGEKNDRFSLGLAKSTRTFLTVLRYTDTDGDGVPNDFSPSALPDVPAGQIRDDIAGAVAAFGSASLDPGSDILKSLNDIGTGIDGANGTSPAEKVRTYLAAQFI